MLSKWKRFSRFTRIRIHQSIRWISDHISQRNYQIIVSIIIGIAAGLAAVVLKYAVQLVRDWMQGNDPTQGRIGFVFFPLLGIILTVLYLRYILRKKLDIGFPGLIFSIAQKKVNLPRREIYAHTVSSSLTVGLGGSVGLEAPIVRSGAAIGSNLASLLQVSRKKQTLFLICGATAGMAAIFNSPVAAVIFAFEVLLTDIALPSFIPLLISAATGAVVARFFYYEQLFYLPTQGWSLETIPFFILLGILCGLYSTYMIRSLLFINRFFFSIKTQWVRLLLGGLTLGALIFLLPPLFGEGYTTINQLLTGQYSAITENSLFYDYTEYRSLLLIFGLLVILAKAIATSLTLAMGGNGGFFAPSMFSGATLGFVFAMAINQLGLVELPIADFIAVAMAGILSGVIKSPLTGIFLIAEITGGYLLFVPLMIVSAISYFVTFYFEPQSLFTKELYQKGLWVPSHEKDKQILKDLKLEQLIERNFSTVHPKQTLGEFVNIIAHSSRNLFPVVDGDGSLLGIILLDDVREIMFQPEKYEEVYIQDLMHLPPAILQYDNSMEEVMDKFELHQAWNLPVVRDGKYQGFVSKSNILGRYRRSLQDRNIGF
ncbi:MAG: chloride channel protein [Saprospiraceae bacterium]|nr:MAG: chloride channel protein [Saprospiraceae bacterium]